MGEWVVEKHKPHATVKKRMEFQRPALKLAWPQEHGVEKTVLSQRNQIMEDLEPRAKGLKIFLRNPGTH